MSVKAAYRRAHRRSVNQCVRGMVVGTHIKRRRAGYRGLSHNLADKTFKESHCPKPRKPRQGTPGIRALSHGMASWENWARDMETPGEPIFDGAYWPQMKGR